MQRLPDFLAQCGKVHAPGAGCVAWRQLFQVFHGLVVITVGQAAMNPAFVQRSGKQNHTLQEVALGACRL
ncbi:hypothetical protein DEDE109153_11160 [Deinococcus deserti]